MSAQHTDQHSSSQNHRVEGPKNHYLSYIVSIILTMLAFAGVIYGGLDRTFLLVFIVVLAIVQAFFQMFIWMHMKDRDHFFPILFIFSGIVVAITVVIAGVYWMWW